VRISKHSNAYREEYEDILNAEDDQETPNYYYYRIPLNEPESLFFTAFKSIPKPLPPIVEKFAMRRKDLPLNIYN
jgi:hypothetical protein